MVEKYNNTYHRSIKLTPSDARNPANYQHVPNAVYAKVNARKARYLNSMLVIGYTPNWTEEVFTISSVKATKPPTYTIKDTLGEPVQETFHEQELQLSAQEIFVSNKYSRRRKIKYLPSGKVTVTLSIRGYH